MKSLLLLLSLVAFVGTNLFLLESACFRLVESYAKARLRFAWGVPGDGHFHPYLKKLPLGHYKVPPSEQSPVERITAEDSYATTIMEFGRPLRDRFKSESQSLINPILSFEIRDLGEVENVVIPGIRRIASKIDVEKKLARRIGDPIEFAKGLILRVLPENSKFRINEEYQLMEMPFKFFLENGVACAVVKAKDVTELLETTYILRKNYPMIAENLYLWGEYEAADYILEATFQRPEAFKAIITLHPTKSISSPPVKGMPWILCALNVADLKDEKIDSYLGWVDRARDADTVYTSRLGGLLRIIEPSKVETFNSFAVAYLLEAFEIVDNLGDRWPKSRPLGFSTTQELLATEGGKDPLVLVDLPAVEEKLRMLDQERVNHAEVKASFDCKMVKQYRILHAGDKNLKQITNRDLVIKLGLSFEQMGQNVLEEVGKKDPMFLRFYKSLREVTESPLN